MLEEMFDVFVEREFDNDDLRNKIVDLMHVLEPDDYEECFYEERAHWGFSSEEGEVN